MPVLVAIFLAVLIVGWIVIFRNMRAVSLYDASKYAYRKHEPELGAALYARAERWFWPWSALEKRKEAKR